MVVRRQIFRCITLIAAALVVTGAGPVTSKAKPSNGKVNGAYKVFVRGDYTGNGNAAVGAANVNIDTSVTDDAGNSIHFHFPNLNRSGPNNLCFGGGGTINGVAFTLSGRIDPAGGTLHVDRLSTTAWGSNGVTVRIYGTR